MKPVMETVVSCVYIYLLMSAHPIDAARIKRQTMRAATVMDQTQEVMQELQKALQEDTSNAGQEYIGESWASCEQRKKDFERRTVKARARYDEAAKDGNVDTFEAAWVLLKMRSLAKTLSAARNDGCQWVEEQGADMSVMKELVAETAGKSKCFEKSKAHMETVRTKSPADQSKAFGTALRIFLSGDKYCKPIDVQETDTAASAKDEVGQEVETDEAAEVLAEEAGKHEKEKRQEAESEVTKIQSIVEKGTDSALKASALLQAHAPLIFLPSSDSLMETGEAEAQEAEAQETGEAEAEDGKWGWGQLRKGFVVSLSSGSGQGQGAEEVNPIVVLVVAAVMFLIFFALAGCILGIIAFVLGLIFCMLKMVFVALVRILGGHRYWNFNFSGCMGFWLQGMAHPSPVANCAISIMNTLSSDDDYHQRDGQRRFQPRDGRRRWN